MGYFSVSELPFFENIDAKFYQLQFFSDKLELSYDELVKVFNCFNDYARRVNVEYPEASFMIGLSSSDSSDCRKIAVKSGKRGRPKKIVEGKKVAPHIHIAGVGKKIKPAMQAFKEKIDKKFAYSGVKVARVNSFSGAGFVEYINMQSDACRCVGSFDFDGFKSSIARSF